MQHNASLPDLLTIQSLISYAYLSDQKQEGPVNKATEWVLATWYTYFYACLQKVGETEMNPTSLLERDWFSCDETEICPVCDLFVFRSNTVETKVL